MSIWNRSKFNTFLGITLSNTNIIIDTLNTTELWDNAIIRCHEKDLENIDIILEEIRTYKEDEMRQNCLTIYNDFKNDFLRN